MDTETKSTRGFPTGIRPAARRLKFKKTSGQEIQFTKNVRVWAAGGKISIKQDVLLSLTLCQRPVTNSIRAAQSWLSIKIFHLKC